MINYAYKRERVYYLAPNPTDEQLEMFIEGVGLDCSYSGTGSYLHLEITTAPRMRYSVSVRHDEYLVFAEESGLFVCTVDEFKKDYKEIGVV